MYLGTENHDWVSRDSLVTPKVYFTKHHWRVSNFCPGAVSTATYSPIELIDNFYIRTINAEFRGDFGFMVPLNRYEKIWDDILR